VTSTTRATPIGSQQRDVTSLDTRHAHWSSHSSSAPVTDLTECPTAQISPTSQQKNEIVQYTTARMSDRNQPIKHSDDQTSRSQIKPVAPSAYQRVRRLSMSKITIQPTGTRRRAMCPIVAKQCGLSGETAGPLSGETARPLSGETARPMSGETARPVW